MKRAVILISMVMWAVFTTRASLEAWEAHKAQTLSGEVVSMNAETQDVVIKVGNKLETLKAEPKIVAGVSPGEWVTFQKIGQTLKAIKAVAPPMDVGLPDETEEPLETENE